MGRFGDAHQPKRNDDTAIGKLDFKLDLAHPTIDA